MDTKQCGTCKEIKSIDQFNKNKEGKYGLRSNCKECLSKYSKEYYINNKNRLKKYNKENHKEYINNNKAKIAKYQKEYHKKYRQTERGKLIRKIHNQNRHYKKKYNTNSGERLTKEQIEYLTKVYTHCAYCSTPLTSDNTHIDHIHPLSKEGSHSIDNVVLACKDCNLQKNAKTLDQWLDETGYSISIKHLVFMRL
jgi:5-methylcytosine-specific restriction endonuclease McrA